MAKKINKYGKSFNCSVKDYNKLRSFLRYAFLYGCYTKDDFVERFNYSCSLVDKDYRRLINILGDKHFKKKTPKQTRFRMNYRYYKDTENYLVKSYYAKSSTKIQLSLYFFILQVLNKRMDVNEIMAKIPTLTEDFNVKTLTRQLDKMAELDLIEKIQYKKNGKLYYQPKTDFFSVFSDDDLKSLKYAVDFFCNIEFPSVPGYYLSNTIDQYLRYYRKNRTPKVNLFLYRFKNFHTILEEDIAWKLLWCINNNKNIKIKYVSRNGIVHKIISPRRIIIDVYYGRWYLIAGTSSHLVNIYRMDKITDFSLTAGVKNANCNNDQKDDKYFEHSWSVSPLEEKEGLSIVKIRFSVAPHQDLSFLLNKVNREGKWGTITQINDKSFIYTIQVNDVTEMKPWIRSFGPYAEVLESTNIDLRKELSEEWSEMLENYGVIS
ncbi:MAG: WYL domain-containing protein [Clostridiales bacterium]|nr:WYL domain-containing protein [Clostridiales bacterium]